MTTTPKQFLDDFPAPVKEIARLLRQEIKKAVPECVEAVYPGWRLLGYKKPVGRRKVYFAYVLPKQDCVKLGFEHGVLLSDPENLLTGTGKQVREILFSAPDDHPSDLIRRYIIEAAHVAVLSPAEKARILLNRR